VRIAYVCLQPRTGGGASDTHVDGLIRGLRDAGHDVELMEPGPPARRLTTRLVRVLLLQFRSFRAIRRADVAYIRMHPAAVVSAMLLPRKPLAVEVNGVAEDYYVSHPVLRRFQAVLRLSLLVLLRRSDVIFCVTEGLRTRVEAQLRERSRIVVVPNAADPDVFDPTHARPQELPRRYALFFGALAPWQGLDLVLAAAENGAWPDDVSLVVIGDGPERQLVERAQERRPDRIHHLGPLPAAALPPYVVHAEATFVTKRYHDSVAGQSPLKLYESLAAGVPAIATPMSGVTDVPHLQDGVYVVDATAPGLAGTLARITADPATAADRGARARRQVIDHHTWDHRARTVVTELSRLLPVR
jgi:glycosyltransferase involved in cell wall biosynthesis